MSSRKEQVQGLEEQLAYAKKRRQDLRDRGYNGFVFASLGQHIVDLENEINSLDD